MRKSFWLFPFPFSPLPLPPPLPPLFPASPTLFQLLANESALFCMVSAKAARAALLAGNLALPEVFVPTSFDLAPLKTSLKDWVVGVQAGYRV